MMPNSAAIMVMARAWLCIDFGWMYGTVRCRAGFGNTESTLVFIGAFLNLKLLLIAWCTKHFEIHGNCTLVYIIFKYTTMVMTHGPGCIAI